MGVRGVTGGVRAGRGRGTVLALVAGACLWLVPWTGYLATSLPDQHDTYQWRLAWVGFDIALLGCFGVAAWLGWYRRRAAAPMLTATAALICCDAWFDVLLDWNSPDWWVSVLMAALVEVPVAVFLLLRARVPLIGGIRRRQLTIEDIEVHTDPTIERLLRRLGRGGPATPEALAVALGLRLDAVTAKLSALERQGYVRRGRGGRWRDVPHDLRMPELDEVAEADRDRYRTYLDAKYDKELRLFAIAARHRERLGPWGQGSRGNAYLTETELARFTDEYLELLLRYCQLHERSDPRVRQVALRFYAFPQSLTDELPDELPDCPQPAPAPAR